MARGIPECGQHLNCYLCVVRKIYSVTKEDTSAELCMCLFLLITC